MSHPFVTVEMEDGQVYVGTLVTDRPDRWRLRSGYRGRPRTIDPDRVVEVRAVDEDNPNIERREHAVRRRVLR